MWRPTESKNMLDITSQTGNNLHVFTSFFFFTQKRNLTKVSLSNLVTLFSPNSELYLFVLLNTFWFFRFDAVVVVVVVCNDNVDTTCYLTSSDCKLFRCQSFHFPWIIFQCRMQLWESGHHLCDWRALVKRPLVRRTKKTFSYQQCQERRGWGQQDALRLDHCSPLEQEVWFSCIASITRCFGLKKYLSVWTLVSFSRRLLEWILSNTFRFVLKTFLLKGCNNSRQCFLLF